MDGDPTPSLTGDAAPSRCGSEGPGARGARARASPIPGRGRRAGAIGSIEIFDKKLKERKERFKEIAHQVHRSLEDAPSFENIINITEKNGIFFIFTNTTRLAMDIGKFIRQEFSGGIQYEWFERNQYLRIKWYDTVDNKAYFKERLRWLKDQRFGMFSFEDEG